MRRLFAFLLISLTTALHAADAPLRALIIDGRNNHDWRSTSDFLRATLEATGRFEVSVSTAPQLHFPAAPRRVQRPEDEAALAEAKALFKESEKAASAELAERWQQWAPDFSQADVVVLNYNGDSWPAEMAQGYIDFVRQGGGTVLVHGSNNAFRNWPDFNELIGLGWRPAPIGRALKVNPDTGEIYTGVDAELPGKGNSGHGSKHAFQVAVRAKDHPIMAGVPELWMHGSDELYHNMRGPAKNLTVLSSAYADPAQRGSGLHEPITWEVAYGQGRAIVTSMGHMWAGDIEAGRVASLKCVGFQTIFARSCEYAATGAVRLPVPEGFPSADEVSTIAAHELSWIAASEEKSAAQLSMEKKKAENPYCLLTPEEQLTTFEIAPGYVAELFAAEPQVQEPVLMVWDSDGAMYVAEMRGYMQDVEGTATKTLHNGRVKRLVDTDGDGRADQVTTFVDNMNNPRAIQPLADGWIAIRESDTMTVVAYRDTDGDGVADETKMLYDRGPVGRNGPEKSVEHQDSGLQWNIDNHLYVTYNMERYRYTDGDWQVEKQPSHWTQWGLTHDDYGNLYWSTNSDPVLQSDIHPRYWDIPRRFAKDVPSIPVVLPKSYDPTFMSAYSSCLLNDRGGSASEVRGFTSACGQSIYRADKFPSDHRGTYYICDPTIHVVRRARLSRDGGMVKLTRMEETGQEFLRSSDINCRFINTAEGPDGCLYVNDMYRGIIQDAPWLNPDARKNIVQAGLDKNIQHGRIWRIRHTGFQPRSGAALPQMSSESTVALLRHLGHASGWWRDTAQREIILRDDRDSVEPHLRALARFSDSARTRFHALWTLEGMGRADVALLGHMALDREAHIRRAAVQIAEPLLGEAEAFDAVARPLAQDRDDKVAKQLILSLGIVRDHPDAAEVIQQLARKHPQSPGVQLATTLSLWGMKDLPLVKEVNAGKAFDAGTNAVWKNFLGNWDRGIKYPDDMPDAERRRITSGETQYFANCTSCHGADGSGMQVPGTEMMLAPSLLDSQRVRGDAEQLVAVFLHGLSGPIDGQAYAAGYMAPAHALGITREDRLSELITYLRYVHGDRASSVSHDEVKALKQKHADRKTPWTDEELKALGSVADSK